MSEILLNSLDILTFVVPPILPAALTANNAFAQRRLGRDHLLFFLRNFVTLQIFQPRTAQLGKIECQAVLLLVETCVERRISVVLLCARPLEGNQMVSTLESKDIFCLHSKHIPLCGGVDIVAFDKVSPTF